MKRILCLLMVLFMLSALVACDGDTKDTETDDIGTVDTESDTEGLDPQLEAEDFGGTFTMLGREADAYSFPYYELDGNDDDSVLDRGIFRRNMNIQMKYNIQLISKYAMRNKLLSLATTDSLAGVDYEYDAHLVSTAEAFQFAVNGLLYVLEDVPYIDLDKPYYDQTLKKDTSIGNKHYFSHGHFSISTYNATSALYLNKTLLKNYKLEDPYALVKSGDWTWEKMFTMCKAVTEIAEDGQANAGQHQYGFALGVYAWQPMFFSSGRSLIAKDANDMPYLNMNNCMDLFQDVTRVMNDPATTWFSSAYGISVQYNASETFLAGRALFSCDPLYYVPEFLLNSNIDYGILPFPKYTEDQQGYWSQTHAAHSTVLAVPKVTADIDKAGKILEDFAYQSSLHVYPVIMDTMIKYRNAQTANDFDMLEIIFNGVRCDLGLSLNNETKIDTDVRELIRQNSSAIASTLAGKMPTYQAVLDSVIAVWNQE